MPLAARPAWIPWHAGEIAAKGGQSYGPVSGDLDAFNHGGVAYPKSSFV